MGVDLDDGQVGVGVYADNLGVILRGGPGESDLDTVGFLDYVIVGEDVSIRIDDHAGAKRVAPAALRRSAPGVATEGTAEEPVEEIVHRVIRIAVVIVGNRN